MNGFPYLTFEHALPAPLIALALAVAAVAILVSGARHLHGRRRRVALTLPRLLMLALLAWCLLLPMSRRVQSDAIRPHLVVLVDTSASMNARPARPGVPTRWETAARLLDGDWVREAAARFAVDVFGFDAQLSPPRAAGDWRDAQPAGRATHLRDSLRAALDRYRGQELGGVVLLSDGLDTREVDEAWVSARWPCPLFTVRLEPPGSIAVEPDVRVDGVNTPRRAVVGWDTRLIATVAGQPGSAGAFRVDLLENGRVVDTAPAQLGESSPSCEVAFRLPHPDLGVSTYTVAIPPLPGESRTNDNAFSTTVQVVDARNRLLYAEAVPRWESKYLTRELLANDKVTPAAFVRGPEGRFLSYGERADASLEMTEAQLARFKIVVLGDLDAHAVGGARAEALVAFVERGGSLVLLGGPNAWGSGGFAATALARLLPGQRPWETPAREGTFAVALTDEGRAHSLFAGDASGWDAVPPVLSVFPGMGSAAAATVLAVAQTPEGPQALVLAQPYGQGKVLAVMTDSLWRWQLQPGAARPYARFWAQALEWLSPPAAGLDRFELDLFADTTQVSLGETLTLKARLSGSGTEAGAREILCEIDTPDNRRLPQPMQSGMVETAGARYRGAATPFTPSVPGLHRALARMTVDGVRYESAPFAFFVKHTTPEDAALPHHERLLRALAAASGGSFCEPDALGRRLAALPSGSREQQRVTFVSLWHHAAVLGCMLALLALEWIVRKVRDLA